LLTPAQISRLEKISAKLIPLPKPYSLKNIQEESSVHGHFSVLYWNLKHCNAQTPREVILEIIDIICKFDVSVFLEVTANDASLERKAFSPWLVEILQEKQKKKIKLI